MRDLDAQRLKFLQDPRFLELADRFNGPAIAPRMEKIETALEDAQVLPPGRRNYATLMQAVAVTNHRSGPDAVIALLGECLGGDTQAMEAFSTVMSYRRVIGSHLELLRGEYSGLRLEAIQGPFRAHALDETTAESAAERTRARTAAQRAMVETGGFQPFAAEETLRGAERALRAMAEKDYGLSSLVPSRH